MSELQKVIKYCAIAFAAFLAFSIISGIVGGIFAVTGSFSGFGSSKTVDITKSFDDVKSLTVAPGVGTLNIEVGNNDKVEVIAENVSDRIKVEKSFNGNLSVKGKFNFWHWFGHNDTAKSKITIYIPADFEADKVEIDAGAGNIQIDALKTKKLDVDAGAGNISGSNITADQVELDGGVGDITFDNATFSNADFDCGVGNVEVNGTLLGKNEINCGVGEVELNLTGSVDDYNLKVDKGVGNVSINDQKYSDSNWNNPSASNSIDIDGGVGNVDVYFK